MKNYNWRSEMPEVPESIHMAVIDVLEEINEEHVRSRVGNRAHHQRRSTKKKRGIKKSLFIPLVAIMCLAIGGTVVAVNLYQQRMEAMSREMLEDFYAKAMVDSVFHFSRELSDEEAATYERLEKEYENEGRFPEGNVLFLKDYEDYRGKGVGLYADRSTLFLPDYEMSEEELLQIIDFQHRVTYSIDTIGTEIVEGESDYAYDYEQLAPVENGDTVIAYEGSVGVICAAEGKEGIYLAGKNVIEKMSFGDSDSEPFYEAHFGENTRVQAMEEDTEQGLYVLLLVRGKESYTGSIILHLDKSGKLLYEKELPGIVAYRMAADSKGRLYIENYDEVYVYDAAGEEVCTLDIPYGLQNGSLCRGKDGKVYTLCEDAPFRACILRLDPDAREPIEMVASEGLPTGTPHCHTLAKGGDTDFVIWRYDGVYTYNLGDTFVNRVMEVYEAPLAWENADFMVLEDGRAVFVKYFDALYDEEHSEVLPIPESVRICYAGLSAASGDNKVVFERSSETILGYDVENLTFFTELYYKGYGEVFENTEIFSVKNADGQKKVIWQDGAVTDPMDMYLIKEYGTSGVILWNTVLAEADWMEGTPDCACDYWITLGDMQVGYHSECGVVTDAVTGRRFELSEEYRELVNTVLEHYFGPT